MTGCRWEISSGAILAFALFYYLDDAGWLSALLPAVLFHELGHGLAVLLLGGRLERVRVEITGLCLETTAQTSRREELIVLAAGPAAGLLWWSAADRIGGDWGEKSAAAALVLNCFNLLPALPLDGGRLLLALTSSDALLRLTGAASGGLMIWAMLRWRLWPIALPAGLLLRYAVLPAEHAAPPRPASPAGRSAPGRRAGSGRSRSG